MTEVHARCSYFSCRHTQASSQKVLCARVGLVMDNVLPCVLSPPPSVDGNLHDEERRLRKAGTLAAPPKIKAKSIKLKKTSCKKPRH
jgi:hypothetical protein